MNQALKPDPKGQEYLLVAVTILACIVIIGGNTLF